MKRRQLMMTLAVGMSCRSALAQPTTGGKAAQHLNARTNVAGSKGPQKRVFGLAMRQP